MFRSILSSLLLCAFGSLAQAQSTAPPPPPPLPPNNLAGGAPQVVYPSAAQISEDVIRNLEALQLTPEQTARVKQLYLQRESFNATPYIAPANPITRTVAVNLEPGVSPPVIRLSRGQQSSIVFSDVNGNPWMVKRVSVNRELFSDGFAEGAGANKDSEPSNVLALEPLKPMAYGNVSVLLNGLSTPIILTLISGQQDVDVRVDAKIPGRNPDAGGTVSVTSLPQINTDLPYFLDGTPPEQAKRLKVRGLDGTTAWAYRNNLYLRTNGTAQYPAYLDAARSTSGLSVYRYAGLHDMVTVTVGGRAVTIFIE
jgi:intracellular multiplication protein IcmK